ncbi:T9SS type A sorting domain-containing protein [bacterium]|nr:T9SS type A sorting domain-containing protein [bacterium]
MRSYWLWIMALLLSNMAFGDWRSSIHGECDPVSIAADSSGNRILVGLRTGGIWLTNDGGQEWEQLNSRITGDSKVLRPASSRMNISGSNGDTLIVNCNLHEPRQPFKNHFHSFDGGQTWDYYDINPFWPDTLDNITFGGDPVVILPDRIYYARQNGFAISDDDGDTWIIVDINRFHRGIEGMFFEQARPDTIYLYGSWGQEWGNWGPEVGGIIASYDGGWTWQRLTPMQDLTDHDGQVNAMARGAGGTLYALVMDYPTDDYPFFLRSDDDGQSWSWVDSDDSVEDASPDVFLAAPEVPGRLICGSHSNRGIWESNDSGETWHRLFRGLPEVPRYCETMYRNPLSGHLYIGLRTQGVFRSTDFGETWQQVPGPPVGSESSEGRGLIIDEGGVLQGSLWGPVNYATANNTQFAEIPVIGLDDEMRYSIYPAMYKMDTISILRTRYEYTGNDADFCIISSDDNGINWSESAVIDCEADNLPGNPLSIMTDSHEYIICDQNSPELAVSANYGDTWQYLPMPFQYKYLMKVDNYLTVKSLPASQSDLYRSYDMGQTWESLDFPDSEVLINNGWTPHLACNDTLYIRGEDYIWALAPEGPWEQRGQISENFEGVIILDWDLMTTDQDTLIIAGASCIHELCISHDMGWTWEEQEIVMPGPYDGEVTLQLEYDPWRDRLWLDTGVGLAYLDDPTSAVGEDVWVFQPANYVTLETYPNPFNATTTVRYTVTRPGTVTVTVFDLLGRRVAELYDGVARPGEHTVSFDGSGLSSGTYFLHLDTTELTLNRKLTLVK